MTFGMVCPYRTLESSASCCEIVCGSPQRTRLANFTSSFTVTFPANARTRNPRCAERSRGTTSIAARVSLLAKWVTEYLEDFARSHGWPPTMRAARVIRNSFEKPLDVDRIARAVGCARSGLIRSFKDVYGMSMGDYQTRCRVRSAFGMLRAPDSNVGAAAFHVGYQSTKNFYRALRELTGMTPSQVRELRDDVAKEIVDALVQLPATVFKVGSAA
jgi:AraC-like DNA-binding protein